MLSGARLKLKNLQLLRPPYLQFEKLFKLNSARIQLQNISLSLSFNLNAGEHMQRLKLSVLLFLMATHSSPAPHFSKQLNSDKHNGSEFKAKAIDSRPIYKYVNVHQTLTTNSNGLIIRVTTRFNNKTLWLHI